MKNMLFNITVELCCLLLSVQSVCGQDSTKTATKKESLFNNLFNRVRTSISVSPPDSTVKATVLNAKSVVPFIEYQGKVIRSITTQELGFEKVFTDTSKRINYYGTRILNALHTNTYGWVIR